MDDLIENIDKRVNCLNKILADSLSGFYEKVPFSYYNPKLVKTGIESFQGEKIYLDTSCVEGTNPIDYSYLITEGQRPSRANMQPKERTAWTARMKESYKVLGITETAIFYLFMKDLYDRRITYTYELGTTGIKNLNIAKLLSEQFVPNLTNEEKEELTILFSRSQKYRSSLSKEINILKKQKAVLLAKYF